MSVLSVVQTIDCIMAQVLRGGNYYESTFHTPSPSSSPPPGSNSQPEQPSAAALSYKAPHNAIHLQTETHTVIRTIFFILRHTKIKMPQFVILLVTVLVQVAAGLPADRRTPPSQDKHASWDDVNVVAHGLLQLGLGLKEHVDKTKAQMRDINARLKAFNGTVAELERKQQEQGEALRARTKEVEERDRLVAELAEEWRVKAEEVKKQSEDIHSRMDRLEEKVNGGQVVESDNSDGTEVSFIQVRGNHYIYVLNPVDWKILVPDNTGCHYWSLNPSRNP